MHFVFGCRQAARIKDENHNDEAGLSRKYKRLSLVDKYRRRSNKF